MNDFYARMNVQNANKRRVAQLILDKFNNKHTLVLDLGAGTCVIDQMLIDGNFKGDIIAIDHNDKCLVTETKKFKFECNDLFCGFANRIPMIKDYKKVVIVLSAIIHELKPKELRDLAAMIRTVKHFTNVTLMIREPVITPVLIDKHFAIVETEDFKEYLGLHKKDNWPIEVAFINYCFLKSYGEGSWEREKNEGRFTYDYNQVEQFANHCGFVKVDIEAFERDEFYKDTLPYGIYEKIRYTGTLIVCKGVGNEK